jgi:hypothetical protein
MPPHCYSSLAQSIFAEWGLIKANTRRGVFRVKKLRHRALHGNDDSCPSLVPKSRENGMKQATKRAASEALAQMLAVTAMLVIASVIFYRR